MYGNSLKQLRSKFKIAVVFAIVGTIIMVISNLTGGDGFGIKTVNDLLETLGLIVISPIVMLLGVFGLTLNVGPTLKGLIAPIPIISMLLEYFKGMFMAASAFVYILKNRDAENE